MNLKPYRPPAAREWSDQPPTFMVRPGSSDEKGIKDVFDSNSYRRPRLGFTIEHGERWVDGGCNVGAFSVLADRYLGADVIAFEPDADNLAVAQTNLEMNRCTRTELIHAALIHDAQPGQTVKLYKSPKPEHYWRQSTVINRKGSKPVTVETVDPADLIADGWDCWKLDIEGAEIPILEQADFSKVRKLATEWSFDVDDQVDRFYAVVERLRGFGFENISAGCPPGKYPAGTKWTWFPAATYLLAWR